MEFISDNLVWFIVGGIVILMTIIGFIAEKTDFGRKSFQKKEKVEKTPKEEKVKKEKKKDKKEKNVNLETTEPIPVVQETTENVEPAIEFEDKQEDNISSSVITEPTLEELSVPLEDVKEPSVEPVVIEEELKEETEEKNEKFANVQPEDLKLPELDTLENTNSIAEDDDIWKF